MMKSQGSMVAEDRQVLLAEQNASMGRLVNSISATVNRDLPLRMEEIVRAEVHPKQLALLHQSAVVSTPCICNLPLPATLALQAFIWKEQKVLHACANHMQLLLITTDKTGFYAHLWG